VAGLDTTALSNGVHTIAWIVTANNGETDGIGSRYFTVANGSSLAAAPDAYAEPVWPGHSMTLAEPVAAVVSAGEVDAAPLDSAPIAGRRGFDLTAPTRTF
jgi:hypothetical protein